MNEESLLYKSETRYVNAIYYYFFDKLQFLKQLKNVGDYLH